MPTVPTVPQEKRLIILLPADLLEQVRETAEEEDLSVSQVVRRAIRNELQRIAHQKAFRLNADPFGEISSKALLTNREEDLVRLVADGLRNHEIARRLNLSEHAVRNDMFRIFDKLGISSRVELVLYAGLNNSKRLPMPTATRESQDSRARAKEAERQSLNNSQLSNKR
jgi:DNA-binding NarL/FixJ family response regulator